VSESLVKPGGRPLDEQVTLLFGIHPPVLAPGVYLYFRSPKLAGGVRYLQ